MNKKRVLIFSIVGALIIALAIISILLASGALSGVIIIG